MRLLLELTILKLWREALESKGFKFTGTKTERMECKSNIKANK